MVTQHADVGAVLWDFDGTLGHRRHGTWAECILEILDRQQPDHLVTRTDLFDALSTGFPWHTPDQPHPHLADPDAWWAHITDVVTSALRTLGMPPDAAAAAAHATRTTYTAPATWSLYPQTIDVLVSLTRQGWRHIVCSNHAPELDLIINRLGLAPHLHAVVNSAATGYEKPHPHAFALAREAAGPAEHLWMVGDNPRADAAGANAAGIDAICVHRTQPDDLPDLPEAANIIISHTTPAGGQSPQTTHLPPIPQRTVTASSLVS